MKTIITLLLLAPISLMAQKSISPAKKTMISHKKKQTLIKESPKKVMTPRSITTDPIYPGGMEALDQYVQENFKMPRKDKKRQAQGEVVIKFTIGADGVVKDPKIINGGMSPKINEAALKVINSLPNWTAGTLNGEPTDVLYAYTLKVG